MPRKITQCCSLAHVSNLGVVSLKISTIQVLRQCTAINGVCASPMHDTGTARDQHPFAAKTPRHEWRTPKRCPVLTRGHCATNVVVHSQIGVGKFVDIPLRAEVIMNILNGSNSVVDNAVRSVDGNSSQPLADPDRGPESQPVGPVGSEDVTVRRVPQNSSKSFPPGAKTSIGTAGSPSSHCKHVLAGLMLASMVGCGTTTGDRAISGAGIGAGAGAVLGTVTGMGPGTGAAIGAAAGAATGGLTKKKQINLGKPIWR